MTSKDASAAVAKTKLSATAAEFVFKAPQAFSTDDTTPTTAPAVMTARQRKRQRKKEQNSQQGHAQNGPNNGWDRKEGNNAAQGQKNQECVSQTTSDAGPLPKGAKAKPSAGKTAPSTAVGASSNSNMESYDSRKATERHEHKATASPGVWKTNMVPTTRKHQLPSHGSNSVDTIAKNAEPTPSDARNSTRKNKKKKFQRSDAAHANEQPSASTKAPISYLDALKKKKTLEMPRSNVSSPPKKNIGQQPGPIVDEAFPSLSQNTPGLLRVSSITTKVKQPKARMQTKPELMLGDGLFLTLQSRKKLKNAQSKQGKISLVGGGGSAVVRNDNKHTNLQRTAASVSMPSNVLDSSAPVKKRGKEREQPKKKKLTELKKIIVSERNVKKALRYEDQLLELDKELNSEIKQLAHCQLLIVKALRSFGCEAELDLGDDENDLEAVAETAEEKKLRLRMVERFQAINKVHTRKFREYCSHNIDTELNQLTIELLKKLVAFQDRARMKDPMRAKAKRRFVVGMREVAKLAQREKLKGLLIAPDIEKIQSEGGLDDVLSSILTTCAQQSVPALFCLNRRKLGRTLKKSVAVSIVGIIDYQGAHEIFHAMLRRVDIATKEFKNSAQSSA